jgi:chromosomal replication initiator protein
VQSAPPHDDLTSIWERVREELRGALPPSTFDLWIDPLRATSIQRSTLYVEAPASTRAWVERRYVGLLEGALRRQAQALDHVVVVEAEGGREPAPSQATQWTTVVESLPLDPRHTFERFVIGDGNRLAHAAALAVAELPGEAYNPLFLHGPPGLGKTHLLGAIGNYLHRHRADLNVHYTTAERFTTEFVSALKKEGPDRFKQRYRGLDALLIDDVQALEGKEHTQEEFVHTFNALHATGKQIVLSSDRPPQSLARLAERLRDRFEWGLCAPLDAPDLRTRTMLLWRLASDAPIDLPEPLVLREIAARTTGNVRRLEGAMTRVLALSSVLGKPLSKGLVSGALNPPSGADDSSGQPESNAPSVESIQETVCGMLNVSRADLLSANRTARVSRARQLAIYLARDLTPMSLAQIAREFQRDHSTILHALRSVTAKLEPGTEMSQLLERSRELLQTNSTTQPHDPLGLHDPADFPEAPSNHSMPTRSP